MLRGKLEPGQEIKRFPKLPAVMQASRDPRKIFHSYSNVSGLFFKDRSPLVLSQVPPGRCFADGNECRPGCLGAGKASLLANQLIDFLPPSVTGVARHAPQYPTTGGDRVRFCSFDYLQSLYSRQTFASDRDQTINPPYPEGTRNESNIEWLWDECRVTAPLPLGQYLAKMQISRLSDISCLPDGKLRASTAGAGSLRGQPVAFN